MAREGKAFMTRTIQGSRRRYRVSRKQRLHMTAWLALMLLKLVSIPAYAGGVDNISFNPPNPTQADSITLLVSGYWSTPCERGQGSPVVSKLGSAIMIAIPVDPPQSGTVCAQVIVPFNFSVPIGPLSIGRYKIIVSIGVSVLKDLDVLGSAMPGNSHPQLTNAATISTYAGPSLPVTGRQATTQVIDEIGGVAADGSGGFYVSSRFQHRVYHVSSDGTLTLVAGSSYGYSGDGGPATTAQLAYPTDIAVDSGGTVYIVDLGNSRIRKVTADGIIRTIAGNGMRGYAGDGGPAISAQ